MNEDLDNLLRQLDRKTDISWLPEMKLGRPAYDCIRKALLTGTLTANQQRNALHALFRLLSHASDQEVFELYVQFTNHPNKKIRSAAEILAEPNDSAFIHAYLSRLQDG